MSVWVCFSENDLTPVSEGFVGHVCNEWCATQHSTISFALKQMQIVQTRNTNFGVLNEHPSFTTMTFDDNHEQWGCL